MACSGEDELPTGRADAPFRSIGRVETLIVLLTPRASSLAESVLNLRLPDRVGRSVFAHEVEVQDLVANPAPIEAVEFAALGIGRATWSAGKVRTQASQDLLLWQAFFDTVDYFDHASFEIETGELPDAAGEQIDTGLRFTGRARLRGGALVSVHSKLQVLWRDLAAGAPGDEVESDWRVVRWTVDSFEVRRIREPIFEEVLGRALADVKTLRRARDSRHERHVVDLIRQRDDFEPPHPHFTVTSRDFHPGLAVVDLDRDGFDDFYVLLRWGPNLFFRNLGDGRFEEIAAELGLDVLDHSSSAVFADFDNDGDADLLLGRTLERSMLLVNEEGRFVDRSGEQVGEPLPYFVSSVSSVDYDGDGLLDLYLSTHQQVMMTREFARREGRIEDGLLADFLAPEDARRLAQHRLASEFQPALNHPGPPNLLLRNVGQGRFEPVHDIPALRVFRNTLQSTWGDYDGDGDPDVYLANDSAPNHLVRNDGGGRFTNVTQETGTADGPFSTGASWGDYDNDGRSDLFVSSPYSVVAQRIARKLAPADTILREAARGNVLFRNRGGDFVGSSDSEPPALSVEKAGWSWGGQFADVDNDGYQDLYVLSGYYTAPKQVASDRDASSRFWMGVAGAGAPARLGFERDGRLDREGVFSGASLSGHERNHLFLNLGGNGFQDVSGVSGLDAETNGRSFALLDFDHDGWQDVALVNANAPLVELFRNRLGDSTRRPTVRNRMLALRFVGANHTSAASPGRSNRDGVGARVRVKLGERTLQREHRVGEGFAAQNSATLIVGVGERDVVDALEVRWPSGTVQRLGPVETGRLLTLYEDPSQSPSGDGLVSAAYARAVVAAEREALELPRRLFPLHRGIQSSGTAPPLLIYTTMATWCASCLAELPHWQRLRELFPPEELEIRAVPVDNADTRQKLARYLERHRPAYRLVETDAQQVSSVNQLVLDELGKDGLPASFVTDARGQVLAAGWTAPSVSLIRRLRSEGRGASAAPEEGR